MHASMLAHVAGMVLAVAMLVLISRLVGAKLPAPMEEQKTQADLMKTKAIWGGEVTVFRTYKVRDKVAASYQAGSKAAHTQSGALCVDPGPSVASMSAALAPVPAVEE